MKTGLLGIILSVLCAIHCMALPLAVTLAPHFRDMPQIAAFVPHNEWFEIGLLLVGVIYAIYRLGFDYIRHQNRTSASVYTVGLSLVIAGVLLHEGYLVIGLAFSIIGAAFSAGAFYLNHKHLHKVNGCAAH